jgi:hypothetical protein
MAHNQAPDADTGDDDDDREHRLLAAVRRDDVQAVARLLPKKLQQSGGNAPLPVSTDAADADGNNAGASVLHLAKSAAMIDTLFTHGGPAVQALVNSGCSSRFPWKVPLYTAKTAEVVRALLRRGADPNGAERRYENQTPKGGGPARLTHAGNTPLMAAAERLEPESVQALLEAGAAPTFVNAFGHSAADKAFFSRSFLQARGGGGELGPTGVGTSAAAAGGPAEEEEEEQDDEDADSDEPSSSLPPDEARRRFSRVLLLLLRAGGKMKAGYLQEALPIVAQGLADAERAAQAELERRRTDPRLAALAREELAGLAQDFAELRRAEAAAEASRGRLEELGVEAAGVVGMTEEEEEEGVGGAGADE